MIRFAFTVREIVQMGRSPHGDLDADVMAIDGSLSRTDTTVLSGRVFPTLSIGEQARGLARPCSGAGGSALAAGRTDRRA
ncbi:hypothetical protein BH24CHL4_BH24CHL4_08120 [soil metagenome]